MNLPVLLRTVCDLKPAETMQERPTLRKNDLNLFQNPFAKFGNNHVLTRDVCCLPKIVLCTSGEGSSLSRAYCW